MEYGYRKKLDYDFQTSVEKVKESLAAQGFGILSEIDVQAAMKKKLDKDIEEYVILGACNPPLASQAMDAEMEIGLLLPCNVIVYSKNGEIFASAIMPKVAMAFVGNPELEPIAQQAEPKLKAAIDNA